MEPENTCLIHPDCTWVLVPLLRREYQKFILGIVPCKLMIPSQFLLLKVGVAFPGSRFLLRSHPRKKIPKKSVFCFCFVMHTHWDNSSVAILAFWPVRKFP